ncbi:replication protein A 70 kDa DNA-binding subunit C-like [Chenopodium quinoa]|uniref:replication protein A 70 kDa DNA-binding subunit C-like n=1 Tax=Chenopodium quinoa TaxID=63459 RepID=UPI000B78D045|nr:replication protein A 70 kDa DNA-binding subunit C-like [Chenopodium quinoa]
MAQSLKLIQNINSSNENITIQARVIYLWTIPSFNNANDVHSLEMVLLDEQGGKIQASVKKSLLVIFQTKLAEGQVYNISNFGFGFNNGSYKPTGHEYKILFKHLNTVNQVEGASIPIRDFDLKPYNSIVSNNLDTNILVDYIGYLSGISSTNTFLRDGNQQKMINIQLEDLQKNVLDCTLWNTYADQLRDYFSEHPNRQVFIVIQFAKIKTFQGVVRISSSLFVTKLHINSNITEIEDFKQRYVIFLRQN